MSRLTNNNKDNPILKDVGHANCKNVCEHEMFCDMCPIQEAIAKLSHYEDLEEQGRLIELPCKVGDDIWRIPSKTNYKLNVLSGFVSLNKVYHQKIENITITKDGWYVISNHDKKQGTGDVAVDIMFGETVFMTKEEAETKLKELKEGAE